MDFIDKDYSTFSDLGLPENILKAITKMGFVTPTPIQEQTIPLLLAGRDVVGIAQTGTGKTAAFGLPILTGCTRTKQVQALILAPTRELAQQSAQALSDFAANTSGVSVLSVYGGSPYGPQIKSLREGVQIVVGTPGRVMDLMERDELRLDNVKYFVLDEADEMLRMGFAEDVEQISASIGSGAQKALFSATMPPAIEKVANRYLHDPARVSIARQSSTVDTVTQTYAVVPFKFKDEALVRVLSAVDSEAAIVFVRTRQNAEQVGADLVNAGFKAATISGDVPQKDREKIVARLRGGDLDVLVATDVAARGLDVERIGLVINYDIPRESEAYVHRIGRTGRAGREGRSITFFTPRERSHLRVIEKLTGSPMQEVHVPSPDQVSLFRAEQVTSQLEDRLARGHLDIYFDAVSDLVATSDLDIADVAATVLALACNDRGPVERKHSFRIRREESVDSHGRFLSARFEEGRDGEGSRGTGSRRSKYRSVSSRTTGGKRYRIEVGRRDGVRPSSIVGAITNEGGLKGSDLGSIDILQSFSLVEIPDGLSERAVKRIAQAKVAGRKLRISEDTGPVGRKRGASVRGGTKSYKKRF